MTAVVILPFAALVAFHRVAGRGSAVGAAARVVAGSAVAAALTVGSGLGVGWIAGMVHTGDLVQFSSPPTAIGMTLTYIGRAVRPGFDAVPAVRLLALVALAVILVGLWLRCARRADDAVPAALHGAGLAFAATVALAPSFHPWYVLAPLVLLAATTHRTGLVMAAATGAAFLVLPDGGGLARFAKFPGAPLMTILIALMVVRRWRRRAAGSSPRQAAQATPTAPQPLVR